MGSFDLDRLGPTRRRHDELDAMSVHFYQNRLRLGRSASPAPGYSSIYATNRYKTNYSSQSSYGMDKSAAFRAARSSTYSPYESQEATNKYNFSRFTETPRTSAFFRYHNTCTPIRYSTYPKFHSRFYR